MSAPQPTLRQADLPRPPADRPHLDARTTGWLVAQRQRIRELELEAERLRGELDVSARVERGAQRVCDRLETELERSRQREARLARALGYAEAQRDELARALAAPRGVPALAARAEEDADAPIAQAREERSPRRRARRGLFGRRR